MSDPEHGHYVQEDIRPAQPLPFPRAELNPGVSGMYVDGGVAGQDIAQIGNSVT